jgi:hypothetical protein
VVLSKDVLPERLWLATDREQFNWLSERLPNKIQPEGTTWHHKEKDGEILVFTILLNIMEEEPKDIGQMLRDIKLI